MAGTPSPKKRPHPARRARRLAGGLSVVALAGLTGCMATNSATPSASTSTATATTTNGTSASSSSSATSSGRSAGSSAVPGNASGQTMTVTRAS